MGAETYKVRLAGLYGRRRWWWHPIVWFLGGVTFKALFDGILDAAMRWAFL